MAIQLQCRPSQNIGSQALALLLAFMLLLQGAFAGTSGQDIADDAGTYVGKKYVLGGDSAGEGGWDCSGLVYDIMKKKGVNLPRTADEQSKHEGKCPTINNLSEVKIGDSVYFTRAGESKVHHVAIVTGFEADGRPTITHAKSSKSGIVRERMSDRYVSEFTNAKRWGDCEEQEDKIDCENLHDSASTTVAGTSVEFLPAKRKLDLDYKHENKGCCCNDAILKVFKESSKKIMERTDPAVDLMISALRWDKEVNCLIVKRIKNLKVTNALYSFSDTNDINPVIKTPDTPMNGCEPVDLNTPEGVKKYLDIIDRMENGGKAGSSYTDVNPTSGAYGRYQFVPSTGADYCAKAGGNCCAVWKSDTQEGRACQDKMYAQFTMNNAKQLQSSGMPMNTCTLYVAHQQGASGAKWLLGNGKMPASFETMKDRVVKNVGPEYQARAKAATTEEELKAVYKEFWSKKFGGDIGAAIGSAIGALNDVLAFANLLDALLQPDRKKFYREGILTEQYRVNHYYETVQRLMGLNISAQTIIEALKK